MQKKLRSGVMGLILVALLLPIIGFTQINLVSNPSLEDSTYCNLHFFIHPPQPWYCPSKDSLLYGTYSNACSLDSCFKVPNSTCGAGFKYAHSGNAFYGIYTYYNSSSTKNTRNYMQIKLKQKLIQNHQYNVEFYTALTAYCGYACNNLGVLFTDTAIKQAPKTRANYGLIRATPQILDSGNPIIADTMGWRKIANTFIANGTEEYLTIGNFYPDSLTTISVFNATTGYPNAFYLIDDVSVVDLTALPVRFLGLTLNPSPTERDLIALRFSTANEINVSHYNIQYSPNGKDFKTTGNPIPAKGGSLNEYVVSNSPPLEGLGVVDGVINKIVYYRIQATDHDGQQTFSEVKSIKFNVAGMVSIYPNPAHNEVTVTGKHIQQISISNVAGKTLISTNNKKINISSLPNGTYFISIKTKDTYEVQKLVKW